MKFFDMIRKGRLVAEVFVTQSGKAILAWKGDFASIAIYDSLEHLKKIHLHDDTRLSTNKTNEWHRYVMDIIQDQMEGAYIQTSVYDATRQALAEVAPKHPVLNGKPPSYGVWEAQNEEIKSLRSEIRQLKAKRGGAKK